MYHTSYGPPPYSSAYDFCSPSSSMPHGYYSPRFTVHTSSPGPSPSRHHHRRATQDYSYSTRRPSYQYTQYEYSSPGYTTHQRKPDHVSDSDRPRSKPRRFEVPEDGRGGGGSKTRTKSGTYQHSRTFYSSPDRDYEVFDSSDEYLPRYEERYPPTRKTPPPPYSREYQGRRDAEADYYAHCDQDHDYPRAEEYRSSRPRRASYASKPQPQPTPPRQRPSTPKPPPRATDEDARRAGIPAGFSFKNWDPTEEPILLLGSVFDANSLGKWIYDWTVAWHGPATPMSEIAGDLWLLLIQLAAKMKRAEKGLSYVRREENRDMIDDFVESGERLWHRFSTLLKVCEDYMLKVTKKDRSGKPMPMGKKSGCEFVDTIFGRDRKLEETQRIMTGIRLWSMRFDANCEDILRKP